jgi:adenylate cyclase
MNPSIARKLKLLGEFCSFGALAGIIYQLLREGFFDFMAIIMGVSLGFGFWILELFILSGLRLFFLKLPLLFAIFIKAFVYLIVINLFSGIVGLIVGLSNGLQMHDFFESMFSKDQLILIIYTFIVYLLMSFYIQINLLLGEGVLLKFLMGKYRKPTMEYRIFMFLDLKSSTTIAERLGLKKYYELLNDFFHEISEPVRVTNAEVYQYVGDEVVFTWKTKEGLDNSNCIKIFFKIQERIHNNRRYYRKKYGDIPYFKAGLHFGKVISAQIGDIKREIVYNGDVLNTSARIQEQCNKVNRELLISGILLNQLDIKKEYRVEKIDTVKLRGKESTIELFDIKKTG